MHEITLIMYTVPFILKHKAECTVPLTTLGMQALCASDNFRIDARTIAYFPVAGNNGSKLLTYGNGKYLVLIWA